jgi:hypothetical protein
LLAINQTYYRGLFYKTHKHKNCLQLILKQKLLTKAVKNANVAGLGEGCRVPLK